MALVQIDYELVVKFDEHNRITVDLTGDNGEELRMIDKSGVSDEELEEAINNLIGQAMEKSIAYRLKLWRKYLKDRL